MSEPAQTTRDAHARTGSAPRPDTRQQDVATHQVAQAGLAFDREQPASALVVGRADDAYERDADRAATRALEAMRGQAARPPTRQSTARPHSGRIGRLAAGGGLGGGPVEPGIAEQIADVRNEGGAPLPPQVRGAFERSFGADLGSVRVHSGTQASGLNQRLGARAFTVGSDIMLGPGGADPGTEDGVRLLAHEVAHTVQQRAAGTATIGAMRAQADRIQRDIGFEFETQGLGTRHAQGRSLPKQGFTDDGAAKTAWGQGARPEDDAKTEDVRLKKGQALLKRKGIEVQADDAMGGGSDLEVVVAHLPETNQGRQDLDDALTALYQLVQRQSQLAANVPFRLVPAVALDGTSGFKVAKKDSMIRGDWDVVITSPQVTMGVRAGNIPDIVRDLHGTKNESNTDAARNPGRRRMRNDDPNDNTKPKALKARDEGFTLIQGHRLARKAINRYKGVDAQAPDDPALEGFLTIVFTYSESAQYKSSFLKNHTPLMAKTDMATIWSTLPDTVRDYYGRVDPTGKTKFEELMETAPNYPTRMDTPLFDIPQTGYHEDVQGVNADQQWYRNLTVREWVRAITRQDQAKANVFKEFFRKKTPAVDQLSTKTFPGRPKGQQVEGYAALGKHMDEDVATGDALPVFELRSATRTLKFADVHDWALEVFDYVRSLNANPGGGHQLIT